MGQQKSKQSVCTEEDAVCTEEDAVPTFKTNHSGMIEECNSAFYSWTGFEVENVLRTHFTELLMTGVLAKMHKEIWIAKFNSDSALKKARTRAFLKSHLRNTICVMSTPLGFKKVFVKVEYSSTGWTCELEPVERRRLTLGSACMDTIPPMLRHLPVGSMTHMRAPMVGIIAMDLCGSTAYIEQHGIGPYIASQEILFNSLAWHLETKLFPIVRLHEVLGDSFMFTVNAPWWTNTSLGNIEELTELVAVYFASRLNKSCYEDFNEELYIRCGVACGSVSANMTGRHFRMYGQSINLAARLEGTCAPGEIVVHSPESQAETIKVKGFQHDIPIKRLKYDSGPTIEDICNLLECSRVSSYRFNRSKYSLLQKD